MLACRGQSGYGWLNESLEVGPSPTNTSYNYSYNWTVAIYSDDHMCITQNT